MGSKCRSDDLQGGVRQNVNKDMAGLIVLTILVVDTLIGRPFKDNTELAIQYSIPQ